MARPAIFLDRDGTIIEDRNYLSDPADVVLLPGADEALRSLVEAGFVLVLVSNQSGIARGLFDEDDLRDVHARLEELLEEQGVELEGAYYCPFLDGPEAKVPAYRKDSELRKPKPGMILQAAEELDIELSESWMIGDKLSDAQAGAAAGCWTILLTPHPDDIDNEEVDRAACDLRAAAEIILAGEEDEDEPEEEAEGEPGEEIDEDDAEEEADAEEDDPEEEIEEVSQEDDDEEESAGDDAQGEAASVAQTDAEEDDDEDDDAGEAVARIEPAVPHTQPVSASRSAAPRSPRPAPTRAQPRPSSAADHETLEELAAIRALLERQSRNELQQDFSVRRLFSVLLQMLTIVVGIWGLYALMQDRFDAAIARFAFAALLQLGALTTFVVDRFR